MEKYGVELPENNLTKQGAETCPRCNSELLPGVPKRCPDCGTLGLEERCDESAGKGGSKSPRHTDGSA